MAAPTGQRPAGRRRLAAVERSRCYEGRSAAAILLTALLMTTLLPENALGGFLDATEGVQREFTPCATAFGEYAEPAADRRCDRADPTSIRRRRVRTRHTGYEKIRNVNAALMLKEHHLAASSALSIVCSVGLTLQVLAGIIFSPRKLRHVGECESSVSFSWSAGVHVPILVKL